MLKMHTKNPQPVWKWIHTGQYRIKDCTCSFGK